MIGFLNIYKPQGMTSFDVVRKIKREVKPHKIGHLGTLDPMAEGILPIAIGQGTRLIEYITDKSKTYLASMALGGVSDTQDQWGTITPVSCKIYSEKEIQEAFRQFEGNIQQIPPMYSAVHHNGQRLYELARQGIVVERKPRFALISQLDIQEISVLENGQQEISFRVKCSEGTYIRTLCHDIGQALGTGAYMTSLIRESWGAFSLENAITLEIAIQEWQKHIINPLEILGDLPAWKIPDSATLQKIFSGNSIPLPENFPAGEGKVLLFSEDNQIVAIAGKQKGKNQAWEVQPYKVFK